MGMNRLCTIDNRSKDGVLIGLSRQWDLAGHEL